MSFSQPTKSSSLGSSYPRRIEDQHQRPPSSLVISMVGTLRASARRCTSILHESGMIEDTHQMDQADRRVNVLAVLQLAMEVVDSSEDDDHHYHYHHHNNRQEQEQHQATRSGRNTTDHAGSGNDDEEEDGSSSSRSVPAATSSRGRAHRRRLPHNTSSPNRGPTN
jgi:hypothetical protein